MSVQLGDKGSRPGDVHFALEKDVSLGRLGTAHVTCRAQYPDVEEATITMSGTLPLLDVFYEATRSLRDDVARGTDLLLAYSLPAGVQAFATGNVRATPEGRCADVRTLSAFHVAGPINVEATKLVQAGRLR